ncbi:MAG: hypothetical protein BGP16_05030 [Sphingobium sp. 66-54]|nr:MAG: hypothetical protein BGP16_05030 [Sphingobium sp. 66-54]
MTIEEMRAATGLPPEATDAEVVAAYAALMEGAAATAGEPLPALVTLDEAKAHLHLDDDFEDPLLQLMIVAASDAVRDVATAYNGAGDEAASFGDTGEVPARLKLAVLTRVAIMFGNRSSQEAGAGELSMLTPLRVLEV